MITNESNQKIKVRAKGNQIERNLFSIALFCSMLSFIIGYLLVGRVALFMIIILASIGGGALLVLSFKIITSKYKIHLQKDNLLIFRLRGYRTEPLSIQYESIKYALPITPTKNSEEQIIGIAILDNNANLFIVHLESGPLKKERCDDIINGLRAQIGDRLIDKSDSFFSSKIKDFLPTNKEKWSIGTLPLMWFVATVFFVLIIPWVLDKILLVLGISGIEIVLGTMIGVILLVLLPLIIQLNSVEQARLSRYLCKMAAKELNGIQ